MRKVINSEWVTLSGTTLAINASDKHGCYQEVLQTLKDQMDAFLSHHARMLFFRLDIHQYLYTADNKPISDLMRKLKKWLRYHYKVNRVGYLWVRELEKAKRQHYHLALMIDGKAIQHPSKVIRKIQSIAEGWNWPKPYTPKQCFYHVQRADPKGYGEAFYRASYLAKVRGKGRKAHSANNYGASTIKPKHRQMGTL